MDKVSMAKIHEILRQKIELNRSYRSIATSLNISISTVYEYISRAKAAGISWPIEPGLTAEELHAMLFLPAISKNKNKPLPNWNYIYHELHRKGVTLLLLWREYKDKYPDGICYSGFCNYYQSYTKNLHPVMRQVYKAGEKTMVDYSGMKLGWKNSSGETTWAEIFVGCLAASQLIFVEATATQQLPDWINSHIHMFDFFGGVTEIIVPDNLKSGVNKAHTYDPDINTCYQHFAEYYGVAIVPTKPRSPKGKAKVENAVGIIERQILAPLRNTHFFSLGEINVAIRQGLQELNNKPLQKIPESRQELFEKIDKEALKPLPVNRYEYASWNKIKVGIDYHIQYANHFYSVPYVHVGKTIDCRTTNKTIEIFYNRLLIAVHQINAEYRGSTTVKEHMPKAHQEQADTTIGNIRSRAAKIGDDTFSFVEHMLHSRTFPQHAYRACLGLIRLANRYGTDRLNQACKKALSVGASRYQEVEVMLKNNLEQIAENETSTNSHTLQHENIRGAEYYQ
jgi:transposase